MDHDETTNIDFSVNKTFPESIYLANDSRFMERVYHLIYPILSWSIVATGAFGVIGNSLTLAVYAKLGFSETIHMSYVALAVSDIGCNLTTMWVRMCYWPIVKEIFLGYGLQVNVGYFSYFTGGWPNLACSRTTALLTAWIGFERCLCVMFPTRVKLIITPTVTKIVLAVIYIIGCCPLVLAYIDFKAEMIFDIVARNYTAQVAHDRNQLNTPHRFAFFLYGAVYPLVSWISVAIWAAFLIVKLKQSARWRKAHTRDISGPKDSTGERQQRVKSSNRGNRVTKTVVAIAVTFILCSSPKSATIVISAAWRDFSQDGSLRFSFLTSAITSTVLNEINSSINIVVYALTGSKFRSTLLDFLPKKCSIK
ncbi:peptide receptor GPCR [Elysia marginata]|uniref:Peptide receptor GPCR n=1 Tax=Elysia marginata TaxID=1093978 RepID=A0AAV4J247_9GAST|nr:peptide receptor GPCR [Elysia marginata]